MGKKGVTPPHIARRGAARRNAHIFLPAGSLINPERWRRDASRAAGKAVQRLQVEDRLVQYIRRDPNNIAITRLKEYVEKTESALILEHSLIPHVMLNNELGCPPYEYAEIIGHDSGFRLNDRVNFLHFVTIKTQIGEKELALWLNTLVAWRMAPYEPDLGV